MVAVRAVAFVGVLCTLLACSSSSPSAGAGADSAEAKPSFDQGAQLPQLALEGYLDKNHDGALTPDEYGSLRPSDVVKAYPAAELVLLHVAFEWCKYCWNETDDQIAMVKQYGGRFISLQVMVETREGNPGDRALLDSWIKVHKSALPTTLEPAHTLFDRFGKSATYLLLDAHDGMRVLAVGAGPPQFDVVRNEIAKRLGPLPGRTHAE